jgi:hypothetical protein
VAGILGVASAANAANDPRDHPTLAIVDFDAMPSGWILPPPQLGTIVAELLLDKLVGVAPFRLLDGRWLSNDDPTHDRRRLTPVLRDNARRAGVEYLVLGSITRFSNEQRYRTAGGGGFRLPLVGAYRRQTNEMVVSIWVSVVDVRSGEVVATTTGEGTGTRRKLGAGALGLLRAAGGGGCRPVPHPPGTPSSTRRSVKRSQRRRRVSSTRRRGLSTRTPNTINDDRVGERERRRRLSSRACQAEARPIE